MNTIIQLCIVFSSISYTKQFNLESCRYPIGIETGKILDTAFSASSSMNDMTIPSKARIRSETDGWCPLNRISSTTYEYIQIDLVNLTVITLIELQGRFSLKPNEQYADAFRIEYRRDKQQKWIKYKDFSGQYILSGNSNSYIPTIRDILPTIIARQIRIIPMVTGSISKYICMRLELYGCTYQEGLISYSIPQGDKRGYDTQLFDEIYDGDNRNGILKDGLGQLTDGILAEDDHQLSEWIGWKHRSNLNFTFYFDTYRNFTSIRIHTSNLFLHDIYLFHSITIKTCDNSQQIQYFIPNDSRNTTSRFIQLSLIDTKNNNLLTNCLDILLTFHNKSKWILISEVEFNSIPMNFSSVNNQFLIIHYWYWIFFGLIMILIIFLFIYIYSIQIYPSQPSIKLHSFKFRTDRIDCCINSNNSSVSSNDIHHHLIPSELNSTIHSYSTNLTTNLYASVDIENLQGPCGNITYECPIGIQKTVIPFWKDEQLIVGQVYSTINGVYGTIFRGYLYLRYPYDILKPILIKTLTTNEKIAKELFDKEHQLMNSIHHSNLVQFYGYTIKQNYALIEHSDLGDLHTYLFTAKTTSTNLRLHMIIQLSNALCYLESQHIIHRDISARNCLIYENNHIKLTNTAILLEQFQSHYYNINDIRLPIRWMSPESISNNEFTLQSDIWSFGITLWEIMTNCLTLPYCVLNDEQVYQQLKLAEGLHLAKPECLSKELIDLMLECWRPFNQRPSFQEIFIFFNKRLNGMNIV